MGEQVNWSEETEVIVVGYGGAGAVTAIAAADAGTEVMIMEKQLADTSVSTHHTPSTRMSGGAFICPEDPEKAIQYFLGLRRIANEPADREEEEMIRLLSHRMANNMNWIESIGGIIGGIESQSPTFKHMDLKVGSVGHRAATYDADFPEIPGSETIRVFWVEKTEKYRHGAAFFKTLTDAVEKRNISVLWGTPGEHLVVEQGAIRGVIGKNKNGKTVAVKAKRGVVLTCGGFEYSDFLKKNYLRPLPIEFYGNPGNTGEGINMCLEVGAAMWHMNCISYRVTMKFPDHPIALGTQHHSQMSIFVDKRGSRFSNERFKAHAFGYELAGYDCYAMCYPRVPCYWIFDEKRRQLGSLASRHGACNPPGGVKGPIHYIWSEDNLAEIDRGWVWKANTIEELGHIIAKDPDNDGLLDIQNFKATVERYNKICRDGEDVDFHRPKSSLGSLEDPPYYAVKLWPGGPNTQGGPMRNIRCQVLRPDKTPISRLYACGELGSFFGMLYNGGGNIGEIIAMGTLAGENVAEEKIWE